MKGRIWCPAAKTWYTLSLKCSKHWDINKIFKTKTKGICLCAFRSLGGNVSAVFSYSHEKFCSPYWIAWAYYIVTRIFLAFLFIINLNLFFLHEISCGHTSSQVYFLSLSRSGPLAQSIKNFLIWASDGSVRKRCLTTWVLSPEPVWSKDRNDSLKLSSDL